MRIQEIQQGLLLAALLLCSLALVVRGDTFLASSPRVAFAPRTLTSQQQQAAQLLHTALELRGGATRVLDDDDEEETDEEEESEEVDSDEEEEDEVDASLAAAALKSTQKAKSKAQSAKTSTVKKTMSAKLSQPKKKKGSLFKRIPYILRACLNPLTVMSMTKHFWVSLFSLDYPPKVSCRCCLYQIRSSCQNGARISLQFLKKNQISLLFDRMHRKTCDQPLTKRPAREVPHLLGVSVR